MGGADVVRGIEGFKADAGVGFRLNVFLLAEFPLVLRMDWAWQLDNMGKPQFNLAIGPTF